jgi:two-component system CAI-1 autoinducer sensor kinase/phosphatase CqsS
MDRSSILAAEKQTLAVDQLRDFFAQYLLMTRESYKQFEANLVAVGLCGAVAMPLYYVIWRDLFPQPYENMTLRLVGSLMCLLIALKAYWPRAARRFVPLLWHLTLLYILPFFFTFMVLMNGMSSVWLVTWLCGLFMLVIALNWVNVILFLIVGIGGASAAYALVGNGSATSTQIYEQLPVFTFAIIIGTLFSYRQGAARRERLSAMLSVSRGISRELGTPLRDIITSTIGLKQYLPVLLKTYDEVDPGDDARIPAQHRRALDHSVVRIQNGVEQANALIHMLAHNSQYEELQIRTVELLSMADCVTSALESYPFASEAERNLVKWPQGPDLKFYGDQAMMTNAIKNLLKASLLAIARSGKGEVTISNAQENAFQRLYLHQSGMVIPPRLLTSIFEETSFLELGSGTGAGLLYSKQAVELAGGRLECVLDGTIGSSFVITLPHPNKTLPS